MLLQHGVEQTRAQGFIFIRMVLNKVILSHRTVEPQKIAMRHQILLSEIGMLEIGA